MDYDESMDMLDHDDDEDSIVEKIDNIDSKNSHDNSLMLRNGHISLFGEIIHDMEPLITDDLRPPPIRTDEIVIIRYYIY